jgi:hypothetical protein
LISLVSLVCEILVRRADGAIAYIDFPGRRGGVRRRAGEGEREGEDCERPVIRAVVPDVARRWSLLFINFYSAFIRGFPKRQEIIICLSATEQSWI